MPTTLLFYIIQKIIIIKFAYSPRIYYNTKFQDHTLNGAIVSPNSQIRKAAMLVGKVA